MTPAELEAIKGRHAQAETCRRRLCRDGQRAHDDRRALLALVDVLLVSGRVHQRNSHEAWRDRTRVLSDAMHLLAHQQARALEWRSVADADERVGIGVYRRQMGRAMDQRDTLRAELARKDAEIQRLKEVLRELVKWGRPFEGTAGHSLFDRWMERADDALGKEVTP